MSMKTKRLVISALLLALSLALTGCHGTRSLSAFTLPDALDETKQYEVVFWAKNDTNKTQTAIYQGAIEDFESSIRTSPSRCGSTPTIRTYTTT